MFKLLRFVLIILYSPFIIIPLILDKNQRNELFRMTKTALHLFPVIPCNEKQIFIAWCVFVVFCYVIILFLLKLLFRSLF